MKSKLFPMTVWVWRDSSNRLYIIDSPDKLSNGSEVSEYKLVSTGVVSKSVSIQKRKVVK